MDTRISRLVSRWIRKVAISSDPKLPVPSPPVPSDVNNITESEQGDPIYAGAKWAEGVKWTQKKLGKKVDYPLVVVEDIERALKSPLAGDWDTFERKVLPKALAKAGPSQYKKAIELKESAERKLKGGYIKPSIQKWRPPGERFVSAVEVEIFWRAVLATATELLEDWEYSAKLDKYREDAKAWARERWEEIWGD